MWRKQVTNKLREAAQRALDFIRNIDRDDNDRDYLSVTQCDELDACRDDLLAAWRSEVEQKSSNLKFYILSVTTAYEQGVGKGNQASRRGNDIENPYSNPSDCAEAWRLVKTGKRVDSSVEFGHLKRKECK